MKGFTYSKSHQLVLGRNLKLTKLGLVVNYDTLWHRLTNDIQWKSCFVLANSHVSGLDLEE